MKTQNPFTGRSKGSLANVTATTYVGQNVLKSKPLEVRNPKTEKQLNVREIFSQATAAAKLLSTVSSIAKRSARTGRLTNKTARTALNAAILATRCGKTPDIELSFNGISLQGNGIAATAPSVVSVDFSDMEVQVKWPTSVPVGGSSSDLATVVILNLTSKKVLEFPTGITRLTGQASEVLPAGFISVGNKCVVFLCFDNESGTAYDAVSSVHTVAVA